MSAFLKALRGAFCMERRLCATGMKLCLFAIWVNGCVLPARSQSPDGWQEFSPGVAYKNERVTEKPWSIHIARIDRSKSDIEFQSVHARGKALGVATLSSMVSYARGQMGRPLVGVNGDYYQMRGRPFAGDPRGLQVMDGELLSGPSPGITFWVDAAGQPHMESIKSDFKFRWPDGKEETFGVNDERKRSCVLYTPAAGVSTGTSPDGLELVLERKGSGPWLPLKVGQKYQSLVRSVQEGGNSKIGPEQMVLSIPANLKGKVSSIQAGAELDFSTSTTPDLKDITSAISGGPILVQNGKAQELQKPTTGNIPYGERSKYERHPRSAIGWNHQYYYVVEVDGRQQGLSIGMTLEELSAQMVKFGCTEVMNLDGGGSAMFWADGKIQNSPCEGHEREIANALIVVRKEKRQAEAGRGKLASP